MTTPTVAIITRPTKTLGKLSIYLRYTQNGFSSYISLGMKIESQHWQPDRLGWIAKSQHGYKGSNAYLRAKLNRAEDIIYEMNAGKLGEVSFSTFKKKFTGREAKSLDFISFMESEIAYRKKLKDHFAKDTTETYDKLFRLVKKYSPKLSIDQVTREWLQAYIRKMSLEGLEQGTIWNRMKFLRTFWNAAREKGYLPEDTKSPFHSVMPQPTHKEKEKLTTEEITAMSNYYYANKDTLPTVKREVLRVCLFCCFTGLPYKDVFELDYKDIQKAPQKDIWVVTKTRSKTNEKFFIPLIPPALELISPINSDGQVFRYVTVQVANKFLNQILATLGIKRHITTHGLRHTFATILFNLGLRLEDVQNLLAHSDSRQTLTYAKFQRVTLLDTIKPFSDHFSPPIASGTASDSPAVASAALAISEGLAARGMPLNSNVSSNKAQFWAKGVFSEEIAGFLSLLDHLGVKLVSQH